MPDEALDFLYGTAPGRVILHALIKPQVSRAVGRFLDSPSSAALIGPFIRANRISLCDCAERSWPTFNAFFTRRYFPEARLPDMSPSALIAPCDGRLLALPISQGSRYEVKGVPYSLAELLRCRKLASRFDGGTCLIFRLEVSDYHRYCYFDDCSVLSKCAIPGVLHTVRPVAFRCRDVFAENSREVTLLSSKSFGLAAQIEVGAMLVGRIVNGGGKEHVRGEEKGRFEFGGSTVILLLGRGRAAVNSEILDASLAGIETDVRLGQRIGDAATAVK